jgi:hypothetical protein
MSSSTSQLFFVSWGGGATLQIFLLTRSADLVARDYKISGQNVSSDVAT